MTRAYYCRYATPRSSVIVLLAEQLYFDIKLGFLKQLADILGISKHYQIQGGKRANMGQLFWPHLACPPLSNFP